MSKYYNQAILLRVEFTGLYKILEKTISPSSTSQYIN